MTTERFEAGFSAAVIGGDGRMGRMLGERWRKAGVKVRAFDRRKQNDDDAALREDDLRRAAQSRLIVLAVPAPAIPEVMDRLFPYLNGKHLITDICSVKMLPMRWMQEKFSGSVVGAHPFFGPENRLADQRVALVRGSRASDAHCDLLCRLFQKTGCETFFTTAEEHDRAVAVSQSLHFALSAAYFALVSRHKETTPYLTPSFMRYKEAARNELTVNASMFNEFTAANPMFPETLRALQELLRSESEGNLREVVAEASAWYAANTPRE